MNYDDTAMTEPSDAELVAMIGDPSTPGGIEVVNAAQRRATAAWKAAQRLPWIGGLFDAWWQEASRRTKSAAPLGIYDWAGRFTPQPGEVERVAVAHLRVALQAGEAFPALLTLSPETRSRLQDTPQGSARVALVRTIMAGSAGGRALLASADAHEAAIVKADADRWAAEREAEMAKQPGIIVAAIEAAGATLSVDAKGGIVASNASAIAPDHLAALRKNKPAIMALLTARKPVAVA